MLTWSESRAAPRERDYRWSLREMDRLLEMTGDVGVRVKPYTSYLPTFCRLRSPEAHLIPSTES